MAEFGAGNSTSLGQVTSAEGLLAKFQDLKKSRGRLEQQWKINLAFYKGDQYIYFNRSLNRIMLAPTEDGDKPRYRQRLTSNQITPGVQSYLAKLLKSKPQTYASPGADDVSAVQAAKMAEYLLDAKWDDLHLSQKMEEAMLWAAVCCQGYWHISWDKDAGEPMSFLMGGDGQPIVDEELASVYREQLKMQGVDPQTQTKEIKTGDIRVDVLSPFQVYPDNTASSFEESKMCVVEYHIPPADVKALYGIEVEADSVPGAPDYGIPFQTKQSATKTTKVIYCGYWLPTPAIPEGRYCVFMDNPRKILQDGPWPFSFHQLPIVKFSGQPVPGSMYDRAVTEDAVPLQKQLNRKLSQFMEFSNLTISPQMMGPVGSLKTRRTNEPGLFMEYNMIAGMKPEYITPPQLPQYAMELLTMLNDQIRDVFGLTEVSQGNVPPNVEAGIAIDLLQEMSTDRFAPTILNNERTLGLAGKLILEFAQAYYTEPRLIRMKGANGSMAAKKFSGADIKGDIDIRVSVGSGMPRTRAGKQAMFMQMVQMGVIQPWQLPKYLDIPDLSGIQQKLATDEDQALREQERVLMGEPLNPMAQMDIMQQIQQQLAQGQPPINAETGQVLETPEDAQAYIEASALNVNIYDNDDAHMEVHGAQLKSSEIENWPMQARMMLATHFGKHLQRKISLAPSDIRTTLSLKAGITPDVAAAALQSEGLRSVTPEMFSNEAIVETWKSEDVSKPIASPDVLLQEEGATEQLQQLQEKHAMEMAQAHQKMTHAEEQHQEKLKQMKQPKATPKGV